MPGKDNFVKNMKLERPLRLKNMPKNDCRYRHDSKMYMMAIYNQHLPKLKLTLLKKRDQKLNLEWEDGGKYYSNLHRDNSGHRIWASIKIRSMIYIDSR